MRLLLNCPIAFVVHPELRGEFSTRPPQLKLEEACSLANAISLKVVYSEVIVLTKLVAGSYFGKGVAQRLAAQALLASQHDVAQCLRGLVGGFN